MTKKKYNNEILNSITKTDNFKYIFIFTIITAIYGAFFLIPEYKNFFSTIIIGHTHPYFNMLVFTIISINTINTCSIFYNNKNYLIRLESKEKVLKELIKIIIKINLIILTCFLLIYIMLVNVSQLGYYHTINVFEYNINTIQYSIFLIFRNYLYLIIFSIINSILYTKLTTKIILLDIIFIVMFGLIPTNLVDVTNFQILPWQYYNLNNYGTFTTELTYSLLYLIIIEILTILIYKYVVIKKNNILKLIIKKDIKYLIYKYKKIIFLGFLIPIVVYIIKSLENLSGIELYYKSLGLNIDENYFNIIEYASFFFNIIFYFFVTTILYLKDYKTNIEQLYLRIDYRNFYLSKTISYSIITLLIMMLQHIIIALPAMLFGKLVISKELILIFITNYLINLILSQVLINIYLLLSINLKTKILGLLLLISSILHLPYNIKYLTQYTSIILISLAVVIAINNYLNKKYNKKIIQFIGGV